MAASSQSGISALRLADWPVAIVAHSLQHGHRRVRPEGRPAAGHRIKDGPKREEIGAGVDRLAPGLFGCHVLGRTGDDAALRQAGVVDGPRQAKIGELHPLDTVLQQDVGRLDVAVHHSLCMRGRQGPGGLGANAQDLLHLERPRRVEPLLERAAGDVLHDQVGQPAKLIDRMDGDDMFVPDRGCGPCLAGEPAPRRRRVRQRGGEDLDGHRAIERRVARLEHHAHPPLADHLEDLVSAKLAQQFGLVRRRRIEELDPGGAGGMIALVVLRRFGPRRQSDRRRVVRFGSLAQEPRLAPELASGGEPLQFLTARAAPLQMSRQLILLGVREPVLQRETQPVRIAAVGSGGHDRALLACGRRVL